MEFLESIIQQAQNIYRNTVMSFHLDTKQFTEGDRFNLALLNADEKLTYEELIA